MSKNKLNTHSLLAKIIVVGDEKVGKSLMCGKYTERLTDDEVSSYVYQSTIGVDFLVKYIQINNHSYKIHMWDMGGNPRFKSMVSAYFSGINIALVMYDSNNRKSFEGVRAWVKRIKECPKKISTIILFGNITGGNEREVNTIEGERLSRELNIHFRECDIRNGSQLDSILDSIVLDTGYLDKCDKIREKKLILADNVRSLLNNSDDDSTVYCGNICSIL